MTHWPGIEPGLQHCERESHRWAINEPVYANIAEVCDIDRLLEIYQKSYVLREMLEFENTEADLQPPREDGKLLLE
ncbi:hypothetical protein KIN20_021331 [Parelaphostrongylus tenuis]|uniref:Uncharacterized protein n=1 Tax=Parelaphostrongylus tenuis TaxID=148309 RepID=A0AAD5MSM5_PARTN|nr:hypothetical protein KIN20_021331 [Parelaphostrongylus tenuis]